MKIFYMFKLILLISILFIFSTINLMAASYFFTYNGHTYEIVDQKKNWTDAASYATGKGGYLVHIESSGEQSSIWSAIITGAQISTTYTVVNDGGGIAYIWIGATDKSTEGTWLWDGDNNNSGTNFWKGQGSAGKNDGEVIDGSYNNWGGSASGSPKEPDDYASNQDGAAIALEPWPKNMGILGTSREWNDISLANQIYFIVEYDYPGKPSKAGLPSGTTTLCQDAENTTYSSTGAEYAQSYSWYINPSSAGIITGNTTTASVDWSKSFNGTAEIYLIGVNPLGVGDTSNKLSITVNPKPSKCEKPYGEFYLCKNPENTSYEVPIVNLATTYQWVLNPSNAGTISGTSNQVTVDWNDTFSGEVKIFVSAANDCGAGDFSDYLAIKINDKPSIPNKPIGESSLPMKPENTTYNVLPVNNATSYLWKLEPEEAASITNLNETSVSLDWNDFYTGEANLSVSAVNDCGNSEYSQILVITIASNPDKPKKPTGESELCQESSDSEFTTEGVKDVNSYKWVLVPSSAGIIAGDSKVAFVKWNKDYYGIAKVTVAAISQNGLSEFSDSLYITINPNPKKPENPIGEFDLCIGSNESEYEVTNDDINENYVWSLSNENAGYLISDKNKTSIKWNKDFYGEVFLEVFASNKCGETEKSSLKINVGNIPDIPETPTGKDSIDVIVSSKSTYNTLISNIAESYQWQIIPAEAGEINTDNNNCEVIWNKQFRGKSQISVKAINKCGESEFSDMKEIIVYASSSTSVDEVMYDIKTYPNPIIDALYFEYISDFNNFKIYDLLGNLIKKGDFDGNSKFKIDVSNLNSGSYLLVLSNELRSWSSIIIKE